MAMQIMPARVSEKNVIYDDSIKPINLTEELSSICEGFFESEKLSEDGEEIIVDVLNGDRIKEMAERLEKEIILAIEKMRTTRGEEAKNEIACRIKDYVLFRSIIIATLLLNNSQDLAIIIN